MLILKQSTASQSVKLGPFVDSTDGATAETALTIANTDIQLSKNGSTMAAKTSGGGTHDANGWYTITLDATDTNTVGTLQVSCKVAGALMVFMEFQVLEEAVYDSLFGSAAAGYQVPIWASAGSTVNLSATTIATLNGHTAQTGDSFARLGAPAGASVSADIAAVPTVTEIQSGLGVHETTIATLASQTSFTLTAGSADNDAYNGFGAYVEDVATSTQIALGIVSDYVGATKTVTLEDDPAIFTMAVGDKIRFLPGKLTDVVDANLTQIGGVAQSATDLKDFADAGYDPTTNKVQGVVLVDTVTTNTDMRGTDSAATAASLATTDTKVDGIKTKTDSLTFTQAGHVDANIQRVNDVSIVGDGSATPFNV